MPVYYYHTTFFVKNYDTTVTADVFILQEDNSLVFINGTAKSDKYMLDLTYNMDAISYEHNVPMRSSLFIPSAHCSNTTIAAPADPSAEYFPASHLVHTVALSSEYDPALHFVQFEDPSVEYVPALHNEHSEAFSFEYVPA